MSSYRDKVDEHIDEVLAEGTLPMGSDILEIEVPNPKSGPQASGDEGGPKSSKSPVFPWSGKLSPPDFGGASKGQKFPCPPFSNQNRQIPPAKFGGASKLKEDAVAAVLADLEAYVGDE